MGRHYPDADSHADADAYSDRNTEPQPQRQPGCFSIPERLTWRVARTDVCVPAPIAWRLAIAHTERLPRCALAECHPFAERAGSDPEAVAIAIAERDPISDSFPVAEV